VTISCEANELEGPFSRKRPNIQVCAAAFSGAILVRQSIAKLLSLFFGILTCAGQHTGEPVAPGADSRVMHSRPLRPLGCGTLNA
jgi:hypothetical protein